MEVVEVLAALKLDPETADPKDEVIRLVLPPRRCLSELAIGKGIGRVGLHRSFIRTRHRWIRKEVDVSESA